MQGAYENERSFIRWRDTQMAQAAATTDTKTLDILDRIKGVFAAKGFDGASMQDLARAAGMSAGNFYRYFSSKDAIIAAIVERELALIETEFGMIMQSKTPRQALLDTIRWRMETVEQVDGLLWAEIEATASRRPEIGALHARMEAEINRFMIGVFARIGGLSESDAAERFQAHVVLVMTIVHGVVVQSCGHGKIASDGRSDELMALVLRTVDTILGDVAQASSDAEKG